MNHNFRSIKAGTFDAILPPHATPERVGMISSGNPDVLRSAADLKRRRGGRVKVSGARPKHRLDRPSRRKFADGGTTDAESDQSAQTTASPGDTPRSGVDALMQIPKIRAIAAGLSGIQKVDQKSPVWRMRHRSGSRCDTAAPSSSGTLPMFAAMRRTLQPSCGNCRRTG
jgi:hypothetical protein